MVLSAICVFTIFSLSGYQRLRWGRQLSLLRQKKRQKPPVIFYSKKGGLLKLFMPVWQYLLGFVVMGQSFTLLRSFVEHCAVADGTRSAVVKAGPVMSLLYLNNNLHHTHHAQPATPWYQLPALHRTLDSDDLASQGAGLYRHGYVEVARRNFVKPFCQPDHPLSPGARPFGARGLR